MATELALIDWVKQCRERNQYAYVLVDSAQAENSHLQLDRMQIPYVSLFEGKPEESVIEIAPLLIPMQDLSDVLLEKVCVWAMKLGLQTPCLSWIEAVLPIVSFSGHLRNFHVVGLNDGQSMMMRWYDTRILPVWLACLDQEQFKQFSAGMLGLWYVNRFGNTCSLFSTSAVATLPVSAPLGEPLITLTDTQLSMLVDASDLDTLVNHLRRVIADETKRLAPRELFEFVGKYQQRAVAAGVNDLDRQTQYVLLALYTSGRGVKHPTCIELMKAPPTSLDEFHAAMQALPDGAWDAAPPLWAIGQSK